MKLSEKEFQLLSLVVARELSGRDVAKRYHEETGKAIAYATVYTTMRRLKESGWVSSRDDCDQDGRIRFFRVTGAGVAALGDARREFEELAGFGLRGGVAI